MNPLLQKSYSSELIADYVVGKLSASEMHAFEKDIANDPMLAEAVEGFILNKQKSVLALTESIEQSIATRKQKAPVVAILKTWQAIAAILVVVVGVAIFVVYQPKDNNDVVKLPPIDTLKNQPQPSKNLIDTAQKRPVITKKTNDNNIIDTAIKTNINNMAGNNNPASNHFTIKGNTFSGTVTDNVGAPISQVSIATLNQLISTTTDSLGHFSFKSLDSMITVELKKSGFKNKQVTFSASKKALIQLQKQ